MLRTVAIVAFGLVLPCAAQAIPLAPLHQTDALITQARMGCGPGMVMANGACVSRHAIRQTRRCARWNGGVCAHWY
jgi:hypothetical protein